MNQRWLRRTVLGFAAFAMLALGTLDLFENYSVFPTVLPWVLSLGRALPILTYRRWPVESWWLALAATFGTALAASPAAGEPWPWPVSSVALLVPMTGVLAAQGNRRQTGVSLGLVAVLGASLVQFSPWGTWGNVVIVTALCCVAAVVGDVLFRQRRVVTELAEEKQVSAAERARRSMVEERARLARELHDVVAHHMSVITVQAETARYRLADLPEPVVQEFTGIAELARGSLNELRGLLTALRDETDSPLHTPQPTLADLDELVERVTAAGTPVRLIVEGLLRQLPRVVQLSAYRIVQEALSNVVRHAGGAATTVSVSLGDEPADALVIEVVNERPPRPATPSGEGHGLVGLRERATLLGGTFEVDQPDGGWRVRVTLPVHGEAA
ncbi:MAG TPA: sensor histidine kinase [Actinophytocola sp.]|nr:sensor histidine kinase [Actinophytocola sp.]